MVFYPDDPGKLHVFLLCQFLKLLSHVDVVSLHASLIEPDSPRRHSHSLIKFSVIVLGTLQQPGPSSWPCDPTL